MPSDRGREKMSRTNATGQEVRTVARAGLPGFSGPRLRSLRQERHWTILELAEMADLKRSTIQHWENGTSTPDPRSIPRLARALGVQPRDLTILTDEEIGLLELRALSGRLASDMADSVGIDRTTWGEIERGFRRPDDELMTLIAATLDLAPDEVREAWQRTKGRLRRRLGDGQHAD
jgi:transcriptional regulator with XRE-family HTH domain